MGEIIAMLNKILWGLPMIGLLCITHCVMTAKTGVVQRFIPKAIALSFKKESSAEGDISPFQALTTSLASTIGTGNIIGLGTAIALGGAGAIFWCWVSGVLGIATKYAESLIAVKYRIKTEDNKSAGGAMYVLENRLKLRGLGVMFAFCTMLASIGVGSGVQINAISETITNAVPNGRGYTVAIGRLCLPAIPLFVGIISAIIVCVVIFGGVKSISKVCETLVPFMAGFYILGNFAILFINKDVLPETVVLIIKSAFTKTSAAGGLVGFSVGSAIRYGMARGLFSNESGMGSAPIIASAAKTKNPVRQALVSSTGTFWDTVVLCLVTGLVLVSSIIKYESIDISTLSGSELTYAAFANIPFIGKPILVFGLITFAFSTILGWSYYGERCAEYLFGRKSITPYKIIYISMLIAAPLLSLNLIWEIADILNALMAIPNLIALLLLRNEIKKDSRNLRQYI